MQFGYLNKYKALHADLSGDTVPCSEWHYKQGQGIKHCFQSLFLKCLVKMTLVIVVLAVYRYCPLHLRVSLTSKFNPLFTRCFYIYYIHKRTFTLRITGKICTWHSLLLCLLGVFPNINFYGFRGKFVSEFICCHFLWCCNLLHAIPYW